jgi:uncharacterized protein
MAQERAIRVLETGWDGRRPETGRTAAYYTIAARDPDASSSSLASLDRASPSTPRGGCAWVRMTRLFCDGPALMQAAASAVANLERHVAEVDALNVFPVPDGDTGTNMLATMRAALAEAEALPPDGRSLQAVADALARGALLGARGNSGVILSQIIRGMTVGAGGRRRANGVHLSLALRHAAEVARSAVGSPVEGTILTVVRDAAEAAEAAARTRPHVEAVLVEAIEAAAESVARTPDLLPVLRDAGVVDSGGQGLYRLLQGTLQMGEAVSVDLPRLGVHLPQLIDRESHGYETVYLVTADGAELDLTAMREDLAELGDSVLVAGDATAAKVHVHGPRPDLAIGYGLSLGRVTSISVEDLDSQVQAIRARPAETLSSPSTPAPPPPASPAPASRERQGVVAVARGEGLARLFRQLGARSVVVPGEGMRPSSGEIAQAALSLGTACAIVVTNDIDTQLAAEQAGRLAEGLEVHVVPTRDAAEGVAALLAWHPGLAPLANVDAMAAAARRARSFRVMRVVRDAVIGGRRVRCGECLALDPEDALIGAADDPLVAALEGLRGLTGGFELVTIFRGQPAGEGDAERLVDMIRATFPGVETEVIEGGQPNEHFLVAAD